MENNNLNLNIEIGYETPKNQKSEFKTPPPLRRRISYVEQEYLEDEDMILIDLFPNLDFSKLIRKTTKDVMKEDKHETTVPSAEELEALLLQNLNLGESISRDYAINDESHTDLLTQVSGVTETSIDITMTDLT
jgi:hypothetical protein